MKKYYFYFLLFPFLLTSCNSYLLHTQKIRGEKLNEVQMGMSKSDVIQKMGPHFSIRYREQVGDTLKEILSYRNDYNYSEYYLFYFQNDILQKWERTLERDPKIIIHEKDVSNIRFEEENRYDWRRRSSTRVDMPRVTMPRVRQPKVRMPHVRMP